MRLFHLNCSPRGGLSQSLALASTFVDAMLAAEPETKVDAVHLFEERLPPFGSEAAAAKYAVFAGQEPSPAGVDEWTEARLIFDRFAEADAFLFNVPMWNAGVPYVLKQWIDIITQPGWAFTFDPARGYTGLVTGKPAAVVYTSGVYSPGVGAEFGVDFHSTFFTDWLRFIGVSEVSEVHYAGNALSATPEMDLAAAHRTARDAGAAFVARW